MGWTRRFFMVTAAAIAGGAAFGYYQYRKPYPNPLETDLADGDFSPNPYIRIGADDTITVIVPRAEMGQGVMTTLAALVAEELDLPLERVTVEHGPASRAYYNRVMLEGAAPFHSYETGVLADTTRSALKAVAKFLGNQLTGGSTSTTDAFEPMRMAGATARAMLLSAAASRLGTDAGNLKVENGTIADASSGKSVTYGEIAGDAAKLDVPGGIEPKPAAQWTLLGKPQKRVDMHIKSTGKARFGIDVLQDDMVFATIRMNPHLGAGMTSFDAIKAEALPGVDKVVDIGGGIGVFAKDTWQAFKGAQAVELVWEDAPYPSDTKAIFAQIDKALKTGEGTAHRDDGDAPAALANADKVIDASYRVPYLAHACMEPMNATARLKDGKLDLWTGTQAPTILVDIAKTELGLEPENVAVHTTLLGGGFGRRAEPDFARYAMRMAKHADGRPVKVTWSREEDTTHDTYRPGALAHFRGAVGTDGMPVAIEARIAAQSVMNSFFSRAMPDMPGMGPDATVSEGSHNQPYNIANYRVEGVEADLNIPVGFWRSVGNSFNGFVHETFLDELAAAGKVDPVAMRLKLMEPWPFARNVVETVAGMSGWGSPLPSGRGRGIAFTMSFGSYVAQVIEVTSTEDGIKIDKVYVALDCGTALDTGILTAQMQSGVVFGLSSAMGQEITFENGAVVEDNFDSFDAMRINQCPSIEVKVLENAPRMGGAGEPGTPPSIPALANAIHAATGKRIRELPLSKAIDFV